MSNIVTIQKVDVLPDLTTLEAVLVDFMKYGKPRLSCQDGMTWYCAIDVFITGEGIEFKVSSDFKQTTPLNAAQQCHERMRTAMKDIAQMVKK